MQSVEREPLQSVQQGWVLVATGEARARGRRARSTENCIFEVVVVVFGG